MESHTLVCLLLALAAGARGTGMDEDMAELAAMVRESCAGETGVNLALVVAVNAGADLAASPDAVLKCYIKCTMETAGMLPDGAVDVEAVLGLLPDALRRKNEAELRRCGSQPGGDACEVAYNTQVCWQRANKEDYFLI